MTSIAITGGLAGAELPCGYLVTGKTLFARGLFAGVCMCIYAGKRLATGESAAEQDESSTNLLPPSGTPLCLIMLCM